MKSEYDEGNRLLTMGDSDYEYDEEGNQLGVESEGDSLFLSTYLNGEKLNFRTEVLPEEEAGLPWAHYSYSLDGRRVGKEIEDEIEYYVRNVELTAQDKEILFSPED